MKIREIREAKQVTRQELAEVLGVTTRTIGRYETGERTPDETYLKEMAAYLGVPPKELTGEEKQIEKQTEKQTGNQAEKQEGKKMDSKKANMQTDRRNEERREKCFCPFRTYKRKRDDGCETVQFSECLYGRCAAYVENACRMKG